MSRRCGIALWRVEAGNGALATSSALRRDLSAIRAMDLHADLQPRVVLDTAALPCGSSPSDVRHQGIAMATTVPIEADDDSPHR